MSNGRRVAFFAAVAWLALIVSLGTMADFLRLPHPLALDFGAAALPPSGGHLAGTDELGRDVLARLLHATRATVLIVAGATALSLAIATILGMLAGLVGGWIDAAVKVAVDVLWSLPFVVFVVLIVSIAGVSVLSLVATIGALNWVGPVRIIRAEAVRLRDAEFIVAARAHGYTRTAVLLRELAPNMRRTLATLATYGAIEVLTLETGLAFVGLSLPSPAPTWGGMLADGLAYFSTAWWIVIATSLAITVTLGSLQITARFFEQGA